VTACPRNDAGAPAKLSIPRASATHTLHRHFRFFETCPIAKPSCQPVLSANEQTSVSTVIKFSAIVGRNRRLVKEKRNQKKEKEGKYESVEGFAFDSLTPGFSGEDDFDAPRP
jgi:hypothetical protein